MIPCVDRVWWPLAALLLLSAAAPLASSLTERTRTVGQLYAAQPTVIVETETGAELMTASPSFKVIARGFSANRPLRITMRVSENASVLAPFIVDTTFETQDTVQRIQIKRALPSGATVYWRALVEVGAQAAISPITGPRSAPVWVQLLAPASPGGNILDDRQPLFVWRSPPVDTGPGPWRYKLEIVLSDGTPAAGAANLTDTLFRLPAPLQANTSYRWSVTATLASGAGAVRAVSPATFVILDPELPTVTLFYQNFPNPFPSAIASATCFWFDVGQPGGRVTLEILDLRGNPVKRIVPADDGQLLFPPGRYGRGAPGTGSNCSNQYVWDGTATDGRPVPPGVYLARFRADGTAQSVRRILFRGH